LPTYWSWAQMLVTFNEVREAQGNFPEQLGQ